MAITSGEIVTQKVAEALTEISGLGIAARRARWPKYAIADLVDRKVDVIPEFPADMDPHDRVSTATDMPIVVIVQQQCEPTDDDKVEELTGLLESIGRWLALNPIEEIGQPIEPLRIDRNDALLDEGQFIGAVACVYRLFREAE